MTRQSFTKTLAVVCSLFLIAGACSSDSEGGSDNGADNDDADALPGDDLHINEIQMLGSHNSYHLPAEEAVANPLSNLVPELWETIEYEHQPIPDQLEDYGIRQFELDVFADPDGGMFANPAAFQLLGGEAPDIPALDEPGFKVAHIADIDTNTTCVTFVECLTQIETWSSENPGHLPIMVMVETKGDDLRSGDGGFGIDIDELDAEFSRPLEMTEELFEDLEAEVLSVFGEDQIITPDDIRGDADTLEDAVLEQGWPTIADSRGKVMFSLVDTGESRDLYTADAPSLEDKLFFTSSEPGRPDAA
ncbi:MAG: Ca2+-dependent phosphoinositide-specific phospholipase C, partial [Microthrixaceae bacterium]